MKKVIVLALAILGLALLGVAHAAPLSFVNNGEVAVTTFDGPDASSAPVQFARWDPSCYCCWQTYRGVRCRWMKPWRCHRRGGWCAR